MPEEDIEQQGGSEERPSGENERTVVRPTGRGYFTRRNALILTVLLSVGAILLALLSVVSYRYGVFDNYIKAQFVAKMDYIGINFTADVFRVTVNPLELELKNATFNDKLTGEKLFFIRDARLGLTVENLYAWQLSRDLKINTTDINGADVWVRFDEEGRSNFANLVEDERGSRVNFKYESVKFTLHDAVVHFNDLSRRIAADANNIRFFLEPENYEVPDEQKRYQIDFTSTDSRFVYDDHPLEEIDIRARAIADRDGADITELRIATPIGTSLLNGRLTDWKAFRYDLNIESTVDLTQTANIFPLGATLRGVGNFKGRVSGEGDTYRVEGQADSQALSADGIYLRAVNVAATVEGTNSNYEANGNAVAELLTFEDFRIDFPKIAGNVRGTGTDFRWVGELQAAAAKSKSLTLGGLFLSDAVAEYKDKQLAASAGTGRAQKFSAADAEFADLLARNLRFTLRDGVVNLTAPTAGANSFRTDDLEFQGVSGSNLRVTDANKRTDVKMDAVQARSGNLKGNRISNVRASSLSLIDLPNSTDVDLTNVRAEQVEGNNARISGVESPLLRIRDTDGETIIHSDSVRIAKIDASGATLGSLNIAGVRLTIVQGRIEGRSDDIDAGNVTLAKSNVLKEGGTIESVRIAKPVFIVEPSGRYRVTADMSLGGGIVGNIPLGAAQASVVVNNERVDLSNLNAVVMDGRVSGAASIAFNRRNRSNVNVDFSGLDLSKVVALQGGRVIPLQGQTTGRVDLAFNGTDFDTASGSINADITANAGDAATGTIPVNGRIALTANNGLFNVDLAELNTEKSKLTATGRFDLRNDDSNLQLALDSIDASEIDRLVRVLGVAPEVEEQFNSLQVAMAGNLKFIGTLTGNFSDPTVNGQASLASISLRGKELGSVTTDIFVAPTGFELRNGRLVESDGGNVAFNLTVPRGGANNISVRATLTNVDAGKLLAALPVGNLLPASVRDFNAQTSGTVNISGLPNEALGEINLSSTSGSVSGQTFDAFQAKATFQGTRINVENLEVRSAEGYVKAAGTYDRASTAFDFDLEGKNVQLASLRPFLGSSDAIPAFTGVGDITAKATGRSNDTSSYNINFSGTARDVVINENTFGVVSFKGNTANQILNADVTATLDGRPQVITASINFGDRNMPFRIETEFNQSPLAPFFALVPQLRGISIGGTGTGRIQFGGNLSQTDAQGNAVLTTQNLTGSAEFSQLSLLIQDTPLVATEPVVVRFNPREITFESAKFSGGGSNLTIAGTKAITDDGINSLAIDGRINLSLLNAFPAIAAADTFFAGFADVSIRLAGVNRTARISGTATMENAAIATFIGDDRLTFERLKGRILFSSNQAQIDQATGYLGGGRFVASGGALIGDNLQIASFRLALSGTNITVPLPEDFMTTGDANLEISGRRIGNNLATLVSGRIVARRSLYSEDIDLASIIGGRREGSISSGSSSIYAPRFDLTIEGRDALIIRNNIADLTASASLRITGNTNRPQISGRITANSGTVFFRNDRYIVQRGVLEFPPNTEIEPIINLQAETEIGGYQIFVNLSGPLTDTEQLTATMRSSPALPQADVISLITTGNLSNTESGIPTLAQTGINTAAELIADTIINEPARKATNKLFGLNVFEIDPIISGDRIRNPSARLTVGRQINNNLRVTYATNLSQDQNQVLALEYRVSNKLSFVAQYEQRSLSNVTQNRDNFSFEVRFRRRF